MTPQLIVFATMVVVFVFAVGQGLLMPGLTRRDIFFGVTVPPGARATPAGRRIIRGYRLLTVLLAAVALLVMGALYLLATDTVLFIALPIVLLGFLLLDALPYLWAYRASRALARAAWPEGRPGAPPQAAELRPRRYGDYVPWAWELLPPLVIAATVAYLATLYAAAPAVIPTHFGLDGAPNAYSDKTIGSFFGLVWVQLALYVLLTSLTLLLVRARAVPGEAEARFRRAWIRFLYALKLALMAYLGVLGGAIAYFEVQGAAPPTWIIFVPLLVTAAILVGSLVLALRTGQGGARLAGGAATDRLDDRYWRLGVIYVNRDDPSVFVERRFGIGWTLNFGNPRGVLLFLALLAVPIALPFILILTSAQRR